MSRSEVFQLLLVALRGNGNDILHACEATELNGELSRGGATTNDHDAGVAVVEGWVIGTGDKRWGKAEAAAMK